MNSADTWSRPFRVFVVEDSPDDQELATLAFQRLSHSVELAVADDGELGIEELENRARGELDLPDVALVDLSMPRLGGIGFIERVRANSALKHLPVVVFSTSTAKRDIADCYAAGCSAYVVKPYSLTELVQTLDKIVAFWMIASRP